MDIRRPKYNLKIFVVLSLVLIFACKSQIKNLPIGVQKTLVIAAENRKELEKVISHYSETSDTLKLKAAYFLIENMRYHFTYKGKPLEAFNSIFDKIEEREKFSPFIGNIHFPLIDSWADSIIRINGLPHPQVLQKEFDHRIISSKILIENIDCAFIAWKFPWARHLTFNEFCNYILPYRFQDEPIESWRAAYMKKFEWLIDSMGNSQDPVRACTIINNDIKKWFRFNEGLTVYPTAIGPIELLKGKMGRCLDQAGIANFAMRAMGIPVAHEVIPQWGDRSMGHDFSAVLGKNGKFIDFLGGELPPGKNEIRNKAPKIFQQLFSVQNQALLHYSDGLSAVLGRPFGFDATSMFSNTTDILIQKVKKYPANSIFLAVFDDSRWVPIFAAKERKNTYFFKKMGREIVYLPCLMINNSLSPLSDPVYIDRFGKTHFIHFNKSTQTVYLERKYPLTKIKQWWMTLMGNGRFEGANRSDFSDKESLFVIPNSISLKYHISKIDKPKSYRYVRYLFPDSCFGSLGEISFFSNQLSMPIKGSPIKSVKVSDEDIVIAFDGKWDKFIHTPLKDDYNNQWLGLDLGRRKLITQVGYSPRNDQNNIEKGMKYELFYWNQEWVTLGNKLAKDGYLRYKKVPVNALFLLKNLTAGKEERIFLYENGQQIWF